MPRRAHTLSAWLTVAALLVVGCGSSEKTSGEKEATQARVGIVALEITSNDHVVARSADRTLPEHGVLVTRFEGNPPAKRAGIRDMSEHQNSITDSDAIETVDGKPATVQLLRDPYPGKRPGDVVTLRVWPAQGEPREVEVALDAIPVPKGGGYFPGG